MTLLGRGKGKRGRKTGPQSLSLFLSVADYFLQLEHDAAPLSLPIPPGLP